MGTIYDGLQTNDRSFLAYSLGKLRFSIDEDLLTIGKSKQVRERVMAVKKNHTKMMGEFPMQPGESVVQWEERMKNIREAKILEKCERLKDETEEAHKERAFQLFRDGEIQIDDDPDKPLPGETPDAYFTRYLFGNDEELVLMYDLLQVIVEELSPKTKLTPEAFDDLPFEKAAAFIRDVLAKVRVTVGNIFPGAGCFRTTESIRLEQSGQQPAAPTSSRMAPI